MPLLILLSFATFVTGIGALGVVGVMTPLSRDLGLTPVGAGWVMSAYAIAYALGSPLLTSTTGQFDRRPVLVSGMAAFAIGAALAALATSPLALYGGRVVMALGAGLFAPAAAAVAIASVPLEQRGKALSMVYGGLTVSQVVGIPAGSYLSYLFGWTILFWGVTVAGLAMAAALAVLTPRGIKVAPATLSDLAAVLTDPRLAIAVLLTATAMGSAWTAYTFLAPIIEVKTGGGPALVGLLLGIYGLGSVAGNMLGGILTDRFGPERALTFATIIPVPMVTLLTLFPWHAAVGGVLLFAWAAAGWAFAIAQQSRLVMLDPARTQVLLALSAACIYVGSSIGSMLGGVAMTFGGVPALGVATVAMGLVGIAHLALTLKLGGRPTA
jgi:predicted MFS family arabinose efflux permease